MNLEETANLLTAMAAYDRRTLGEADVIAWQELVADVAYADGLTAVKRWYAENTDWMMPAHVLRIAKDVVRERQVSPWAPGQYGVPREEPVPEVTSGPIAEVTRELAQKLLDEMRRKLPQGSREALMPRRVAWEKEHAAYARQRDAQPNPYYRPRDLAEADRQADGARQSGMEVDDRWGCAWHENNGYGFVWTCSACKAEHVEDGRVTQPAEDHSRCIDPTCPCNRRTGA